MILVPTEFRLMPAGSDPFTSTNPDTLLEQLATYRVATPAVSSAGLAHLMTGKDLDGDVIGIAHVDSLCSAHDGVSLGDSTQGEALSALVMAHEIGHNFGARHDGVDGICATTPQIYLMAPVQNGSAQFSQCSLNSIAASLLAARGNCVVTAHYVDLALDVPASPYSAQTNGTFTLPLTVRSLGNLDATNVQLKVSFPPYFGLSGASLAGSNCTIAYGATIVPVRSAMWRRASNGAQPADHRSSAWQLSRHGDSHRGQRFSHRQQRWTGAVGNPVRRRPGRHSDAEYQLGLRERPARLHD